MTSLHVADVTTLFVDAVGGGGVNSYLSAKADYFTARGDRHSIIVPGGSDSVAAWRGAALHTVRSPRLLWDPTHRVLARLGRVRELLIELKPDIVEVDCAYLAGYAARRALPGVPIHGYYHVDLPSLIELPRAPLARPFARIGRASAGWYQRRCTAPLDAAAAASPEIVARLQRPGHAVACIPLGVDSKLFRPRRKPREASAPQILRYVGRLSREKGLHVLLQAMERIDRDDIRLSVIGEGPLRKKLERAARTDSRIELLGPAPFDDALARQVADSDVFVAPGSAETFGLAMLEAAACNVPVVAADAPGVAQALPDGSVWRARPGCADDLARQIESALDAGNAFGGAREHIVTQLSWERCFDALRARYLKSIGLREEPIEDVPVAAEGHA